MAKLDQNKIRKTAIVIRVAALVLIAATLVFHIWSWVSPLGIFAGSGFEMTANSDTVKALIDTGYFEADQLTAGVRTVGFLISALPMALLIFILYQVTCLMNFFIAGVYISTGSVKALAKASVALLLYPLGSIVSETLLVLFLTKDNPAGSRLLSLSVSGSDVMVLFLGAVLLMITRAFDIEKERAEEHASIV